MTFRTPDEAVALANNTRYRPRRERLEREHQPGPRRGARRSRPASVWINSTNLFDAASGFGGYRESGFGREGGREGLFEYVRTASRRPASSAASRRRSARAARRAPPQPGLDGLPPIDRTAKLFIGGKQARPDSGYSRTVLRPAGPA